MTVPRLSVTMIVVMLAGCYAVPPPVYVLQTPPDEVAVPAPPPDPQLEVRPAPPDESYVWQDGYWGWDGTSYAWAPGQWVEPPQPGYLFVGADYYFEGGSWRYRAPYWCHPSRAPRNRPHGPSAVAAATPWRQPPDPQNAVRVHAPDVITPSASHTRVRAPDAEGPDALPSKTHVVAPPAPRGAPLPAWDEARRRQLERTIVLKDSEGNAARPEPVVVPGTTDVRGRPEYRGTRAGRPVFGDDPTSDRPTPRVIYPTDHTGAIVLGERGAPADSLRWGGAARGSFGPLPRPGGAPRRSVVLERSGDSPAPRAIDLPSAPSTPADRGRLARPVPEARSYPPPRPEPPAMRPSAPTYAPQARIYSPAPETRFSSPRARIYSPAPETRFSSPAPVHAPQARVYSPAPSAPMYRGPVMPAPSQMSGPPPMVRAAPMAPAPVHRAPAHVAPSGGGGRRR